jgi:hypothetical protein
MSVQKAIDELASLAHRAASESEPGDVARIAWMQSCMCQAALTALVKMLEASGQLPEPAWSKHLEVGYRNQLEALRQAGSGIIVPPGGRA